MGRRRLPLLVAAACAVALGGCSLLFNGDDLRGTGNTNPDLGVADLASIDLTGADLVGSTDDAGGPPDLLPPPNFGLHRTTSLVDDLTAGIAVADLNGDGKPEVLVATANKLHVFFYDGGAFPTKAQFIKPICSDPRSLHVTQFSAGKTSIVIGCQEGTGGMIYVYDVTSVVGFDVQLTMPQMLSVLRINDVVVADIDGNSFADILVAQDDPNPTTLKYELMLFQPNGSTFSGSAIPIDTADAVEQLVVCDWDRDGAVDIIMLRANRLTLIGGPGFTFEPSAGFDVPNSVAFLDANPDASRAAFYLAVSEDPLSQMVDFRASNDSTAFSLDATNSFVDVSPFPIKATYGDFDRDGTRDLVVGTFDYRQTTVTATIDVVRRDMTGALIGRLPPMELDRVPSFLASRDLDGDGVDDLVISSGSFSTTVDFWLSRTP